LEILLPSTAIELIIVSCIQAVGEFRCLKKMGWLNPMEDSNLKAISENIKNDAKNI